MVTDLFHHLTYDLRQVLELEIHIMEKFDFLKSIIDSQIIKFLIKYAVFQTCLLKEMLKAPSSRIDNHLSET